MNKIADSHIHMSRGNDRESSTEFLNLLRDFGVKHVGLCSLMYSTLDQNIRCLYYKDTYKDIDIRVLGGISTEGVLCIDPLKQAQKLYELGCDGVKLMNCPQTRKFIAHPYHTAYYDDMFSFLEEKGLPITIHVADPATFWSKRELTEEEKKRGWFYDETHLSREEITDEVLTILDKHPSLRISFAHFLFLTTEPKKAEAVLDKYKNVYFDLTPNPFMFYDFSENLPYWKNFFIKYQDRILYGTDANVFKGKANIELYDFVTNGLIHDESEFEVKFFASKSKGLNLSREIYDKISYKNFFNYFGKEPKKVNKSLLDSEAENLFSLITDKNFNVDSEKAKETLPPYYKCYDRIGETVDFLKFYLGK